MSSDPQLRRAVVVGVLYRDEQVLLCQRIRGGRYELKWEFPGGKVEQGEEHESALRRELFEELTIHIDTAVHVHREESDYHDGGKFVVDFYLIQSWSGECVNQVFEQIQWVAPQVLMSYDILDGNRHFCENLPELLQSMTS